MLKRGQQAVYLRQVASGNLKYTEEDTLPVKINIKKPNIYSVQFV